MSIQGQLLDVTVVACSNLKDTRVLSRQDPYVCLEYANSKFRTNTCNGGGRNPTFQEKFQVPLIEGLKELQIAVWSSKAIGRDDFIGTGRIELEKVLSEGYDDCSWPIRTKDLRTAGEVKLIMHYSGASHELPSACTSCARRHHHHHHPAPPAPYGPYAQPPHLPCTYPPAGAGSSYYAPPSPPPPPGAGSGYYAPPSPPPPYYGAAAGYLPPPPMNQLYQYHPAASYVQAAYPSPPAPQPQPPYYPPSGPYPGGYPPPY